MLYIIWLSAYRYQGHFLASKHWSFHHSLVLSHYSVAVNLAEIIDIITHFIKGKKNRQ